MVARGVLRDAVVARVARRLHKDVRAARQTIVLVSDARVDAALARVAARRQSARAANSSAAAAPGALASAVAAARIVIRPKVALIVRSMDVRATAAAVGVAPA